MAGEVSTPLDRLTHATEVVVENAFDVLFTSVDPYRHSFADFRSWVVALEAIPEPEQASEEPTLLSQQHVEALFGIGSMN